jgi:hypothetical protein
MLARGDGSSRLVSVCRNAREIAGCDALRLTQAVSDVSSGGSNQETVTAARTTIDCPSFSGGSFMEKARKRLTAAEKATITKAAAKGVKYYSGKKLTDDDRDAILAMAEEVKNRRKTTFGKEALALWAAQIDYAIAKGDKRGVKRIVSVPTGPEAARLVTSETELWDTNGNCGCGGGGTGTAGW